jgi:hypothetical protein
MAPTRWPHLFAQGETDALDFSCGNAFERHRIKMAEKKAAESAAGVHIEIDRKAVADAMRSKMGA